jgi:Na+/H+ antiporter NhaA
VAYAILPLFVFANAGVPLGIGFTISLFVAELAFEVGPLGDAARVGILVCSIIAGGIGYFILRATLPPPR